MPLHEYSCGRCGSKFEKLSRTSGEATPECPRCGTAEQVKKTPSGFSGGCGSSYVPAGQPRAPRRYG
ncbi:MAG: zinc ribbon domain-containing protein [Chloroflexi bacterium]|nr:zinc ribbon domain-containing protein [Chloroflexota bacterium]